MTRSFSMVLVFTHSKNLILLVRSWNCRIHSFKRQLKTRYPCWWSHLDSTCPKPFSIASIGPWFGALVLRRCPYGILSCRYPFHGIIHLALGISCDVILEGFFRYISGVQLQLPLALKVEYGFGNWALQFFGVWLLGVVVLQTTLILASCVKNVGSCYPCQRLEGFYRSNSSCEKCGQTALGVLLLLGVLILMLLVAVRLKVHFQWNGRLVWIGYKPWHF